MGLTFDGGLCRNYNIQYCQMFLISNIERQKFSEHQKEKYLIKSMTIKKK